MIFIQKTIDKIKKSNFFLLKDDYLKLTAGSLAAGILNYLFQFFSLYALDDFVYTLFLTLISCYSISMTISRPLLLGFVIRVARNNISDDFIRLKNRNSTSLGMQADGCDSIVENKKWLVILFTYGILASLFFGFLFDFAWLEILLIAALISCGLVNGILQGFFQGSQVFLPYAVLPVINAVSKLAFAFALYLFFIQDVRIIYSLVVAQAVQFVFAVFFFGSMHGFGRKMSFNFALDLVNLSRPKMNRHFYSVLAVSSLVGFSTFGDYLLAQLFTIQHWSLYAKIGTLCKAVVYFTGALSILILPAVFSPAANETGKIIKMKIFGGLSLLISVILSVGLYISAPILFFLFDIPLNDANIKLLIIGCFIACTLSILAVLETFLISVESVFFPFFCVLILIIYAASAGFIGINIFDFLIVWGSIIFCIVGCGSFLYIRRLRRDIGHNRHAC